MQRVFVWVENRSAILWPKYGLTTKGSEMPTTKRLFVAPVLFHSDQKKSGRQIRNKKWIKTFFLSIINLFLLKVLSTKTICLAFRDWNEAVAKRTGSIKHRIKHLYIIQLTEEDDIASTGIQTYDLPACTFSPGHCHPYRDFHLSDQSVCPYK